MHATTVTASSWQCIERSVICALPSIALRRSGALLGFFDMLTGDFSDNLTRINVNQFQNYCANAMHLWFLISDFWFVAKSLNNGERVYCYCFHYCYYGYKLLPPPTSEKPAPPARQLLLSFAFGLLVDRLAMRTVGCCNAERFNQ